MAIQPDGKIVAAGVAISGGTENFGLARYLPNGSLDTSFGFFGLVFTDFAGGTDAAYSVALQADGRIVVAGSSGGNFALARYLPNGSLDNGFGSGGKVTTDFAGGTNRANSVALQADGKIVAAGRAGVGSNFALARYNRRRRHRQ